MTGRTGRVPSEVVPQVVFTIATRDRLAYVRALFDSVQSSLPNARRILISVDSPVGYFDPVAEKFEVLPADDLGIRDFDSMALRYSAFELSCALKSFAARYLIQTGIQTLIYLDADMVLYRTPSRVVDLLAEHAILLTPHLASVKGYANYLREENRVLLRGVFNGGFFALRTSPSVVDLLDWWADRMTTECIVDIPHGRYVDQRWLDLVPGLVSGFHPLRDPDYNVAYWNLHQRSLERLGEQIYVDGGPLTLFHFSGFDPYNPSALSRYSQDYRNLPVDGPLGHLTRDYARCVRGRGLDECRVWPYGRGTLPTGVEIPDFARRLAPATARASAFLAVLQEPAPEEPRLTRCALALHAHAAEVRRLFPRVPGPDAPGFAEWFVAAGETAYRLPPQLVEAQRGLLGERSWVQRLRSKVVELVWSWVGRRRGLVWLKRRLPLGLKRKLRAHLAGFVSGQAD